MNDLLSELLEAPPSAIPAIPAIRPNPEAAGIAESQESQAPSPAVDLDQVRARLMVLAEDEYLPPELVQSISSADLQACVDSSELELRGFLHSVRRQRSIGEGQRPYEYTAAAYCEGCGPVWLWEGAPSLVKACPWCFRKKAGKRIPRPPVRCADCLHQTPDPINPRDGIGTCAIGACQHEALFPQMERSCGDWARAHQEPPA